ncbi:hypothetical protein NDU88_005593 [Pleurodeles waltl]|uniref:Uncharacterized protein n=1 Tax=Pleurodeles waltl TaxID=8319 RepID=A0AAV7UJF1_PLEWA|nr:hypothetical protein NDU88_005593 [Pleurodeles waltl]
MPPLQQGEVLAGRHYRSQIGQQDSGPVRQLGLVKMVAAGLEEALLANPQLPTASQVAPGVYGGEAGVAYTNNIGREEQWVLSNH